MFCKRQKFIKALFTINQAKLNILCPELDVEQLKRNLESFERIAHGAKDGGPIAQMEFAERFRWLTAVRSSVIQTSRPHPGLCLDLESKTQALFKEIVL